jgi:hypothetical protein
VVSVLMNLPLTPILIKDKKVAMVLMPIKLDSEPSPVVKKLQEEYQDKTETSEPEPTKGGKFDIISDGKEFVVIPETKSDELEADNQVPEPIEQEPITITAKTDAEFEHTPFDGTVVYAKPEPIPEPIRVTPEPVYDTGKIADNVDCLCHKCTEPIYKGDPIELDENLNPYHPQCLPGFVVWNEFDKIHAVPEVYPSKGKAEVAKWEYIKRYQQQGYYASVSGKIPYAQLKHGVKVIPA